VNIRGVVYSARAQRQLAELFRYITEQSGDAVAESFVGAIVDHCDGFALFPERGTRRDDIYPGLRTVGYHRRLAIAFTVDDNTVVIHGVFYGGQDYEAVLRDDE
jgi:plasmid stabilization system protein ParE